MKENILFIDVCSKYCNLAIIRNNEIVGTHSAATNNNLTDLVVEHIYLLLQKQKIKRSEITSIYLNRGPGSFTGTRVGSVVAKTWANVKGDFKLYTIDSLRLQATPNCISLIDARGNKSYIAVYVKDKVVVEPQMILKADIVNFYHQYPELKNREQSNLTANDIFNNLINRLPFFEEVKNINELKPFYIKDAL